MNANLRARCVLGTGRPPRGGVDSNISMDTVRWRLKRSPQPLEWEADYSLRGCTLVVDVRCVGGAATGLALGQVADLPQPRGIEIPYLLMGPKPGPWIACAGGLSNGGSRALQTPQIIIGTPRGFREAQLPSAQSERGRLVAGPFTFLANVCGRDARTNARQSTTTPVPSLYPSTTSIAIAAHSLRRRGS